MARFKITKICNYFDLFAYTAGTQVLKLMFGVTCFSILELIVHRTFDNVQRSTKYSNTGFLGFQLIAWIWVESVISWIVLIVEMYCLWKGFKARSRKHLKAYAIIGTVSLIPQVARKVYLGYIDRPGVTSLICIAVLEVVMISLRIYGVVLVVKCYRKLESPLMLLLHQHSYSLRKRDYHKKESAIETISNGERNSSQKNWCNVDDIEVDQQSFQKHIISPLDLIIDTSGPIGSGQFGRIYRGVFCKKNEKYQIAAKVVNNPEDTSTFKMLVQEMKIQIAAEDHQNIVKFFGVTSDASYTEHFAVVTELCQCSLDTFLVKNRHTFENLVRNSGINYHPEDSPTYVNLSDYATHSSKDLVRWSTEIACGMEHLASKHIVHGDLSSRNILLQSCFPSSDKLRAKVSDFGMSRRLYNYQQYSKLLSEKSYNINLPWRWMSVENLEDLKFSEKSDVWSFGVCLYEIFSLGEFPYKNIEWSPNIPNELRNGLRLEKPCYATNDLYECMLKCWNINENKRPTFSEIRKFLINTYQFKE